MTRRGLLRLLIPAGLAGLAGPAWWNWSKSRNPYYSGPVTDHFDGVRFFNPEHLWSKSFGDLWRGVWFSEKTPWPESRPLAEPAVPPARIEGRGLRVTAIGHASHLIQAAGLNILTDPVWSERCSPVSFAGPKRVTPPGIAFDDLPEIDVVLISHNHYDHLDVATLSRLAARDAPRVIVPLGNDAIIKAHDASIRTEAYDWGARVPLSGDVAAHPLPAYHWSARGATDRRKALWCAYALDLGPAGKLYFAGDTALVGGATFRNAAKDHGPFRLAILPIGAYEPRWFMKDQHMNAEEAVEAFGLLGAEAAIGCHWGVFRLTAEGIDAPVEQLAASLAAKGLAPERFRALRPGEAWEGRAPAA
ncbi:MBL fold metallo-hydrolase [Methylopila sp. M107]|uniref:MBL fold metallo-hydrolase n=1 Tax=Methylopila sp. M107 TaxID=1101190 RepID=UPI000365EAF2|nr:MBL fold metallo-hydrolase [Methylopila sp. M107]